MFELKSARYLAAEHLSRSVAPGDTAVDATMGNGHDTCMLARLVGPEGHVYAFDVQEQAVRSTEALLRAEGLADRVTMIHAGHERMAEFVPRAVGAICFNLGWLPGGNKEITTRWETTRAALDQALSLLRPMGVCTVCVYPGHAAGEEERIRLTEYLSALRPQEYNVLQEKFLNAGPGAPECMVIQRQNIPGAAREPGRIGG